MFFPDTENFLRNSFCNQSGAPLPSRPIALTGVNYALDQGETSAASAWGEAICSSAGSGWEAAGELPGLVGGGSEAGAPLPRHTDRPPGVSGAPGLPRDRLQGEAPRLASFSPPYAIFPSSSSERVRSAALLHCAVLEGLGRKSLHRFVLSRSVTVPALTGCAVLIRPP